MIFDLLDCICNGANPTYGANPKYDEGLFKRRYGRYNYFHMQIGAIKEQNGLLYDQLIDWDCYNNGTLLLAFRPDHGNRSLKNRAKEYCNSLGDLNSIADIARDVCRNLSQLLPGQQTITDSIQGTLGFTETTVEDLFKNRTHAHFTDYGELDFCCPFMYNTLFTNNGQVSFSDLRITKTVLDLDADTTKSAVERVKDLLMGIVASGAAHTTDDVKFLQKFQELDTLKKDLTLEVRKQGTEFVDNAIKNNLLHSVVDPELIIARITPEQEVAVTFGNPSSCEQLTKYNAKYQEIVKDLEFDDDDKYMSCIMHQRYKCGDNPNRFDVPYVQVLLNDDIVSQDQDLKFYSGRCLFGECLFGNFTQLSSGKTESSPKDLTGIL